MLDPDGDGRAAGDESPPYLAFAMMEDSSNAGRAASCSPE